MFQVGVICGRGHVGVVCVVVVWFEPTCVSKCLKPKVGGVQNKLTYTSPNLAEAMRMSGGGVTESVSLDKSEVIDSINSFRFY